MKKFDITFMDGKEKAIHAESIRHDPEGFIYFYNGPNGDPPQDTVAILNAGAVQAVLYDEPTDLEADG